MNAIYRKKYESGYSLIKAIFFFSVVIAASIWLFSGRACSDQLYPSFSSTDGSTCFNISDDSYFTSEEFYPDTEITLSSEAGFDSLYILWEQVPGTWTLKANGEEAKFTNSGLLHEFIDLPSSMKGASELTISVTGDMIVIAEIYAFSAGPLPDFVQKWQEPYEEADVLLISTHADDEVLFFGGLIPTYIDKGGVRIQLAYFSDFFLSEPYRNHELLNGLWTMGVTHYPQLGEFYDSYSESYEEAELLFDYNSSLEYFVRTIRRFKPQVLIGQDMYNGEYGHGGHIWCARLMADAIELTNDPDSFSDSANKYGTWQVPKTYFHLYPESQLVFDARVPLSAFGGKTALEVANEAYDEHWSQSSWMWFKVSDGNDPELAEYGDELNCTKFGLYRSTVGPDSGRNDILENIVTYDAQEEAARLLAIEKERQEKLDEAALANSEAEPTSAVSVVDEGNRTAVPGGKNTTALTIFIILAVIVALIIIGVLVVSRVRSKLRKEEQRLEREKRSAENHFSRASRSNPSYARPRPSAQRMRSGSGSPSSRTAPSSGRQPQRSRNGSERQER